MEILSTERLKLRWLAHEDSDFIIELLNDPTFINNIADRNVRTTEDAIKYIDKNRERYETQGYGFFLVVDHSGQKLGICGVIQREGLSYPDIGFAFLPAHTGKGYAYESARAIMEKSTRDWGISKMSAIVSQGNARSIHLLKKLGLSYSKKLRLKEDENEVDLYLIENEYEAGHRFQGIFQQSAIAIQIYNRSGFTVAVNDAWEKLFETKKSELDGYNVLLDPQIHENGVIDFFQRSFNGETVHGPARFFDPAKSGKVGRARWLESIYSPIKNSNGHVYEVAIIFNDVTDKIRIETELREALEARNLFFSVASHEFRTPITAIKLNAQLMHLTYPQISMDSISKLDRQVGKLSKLIDEMLDISRLSQGKMELKRKEMNLSQLTREVLYGMMDQLNLASITLTVNAPESVMGFWDPDRLEQVVENLVTNVIRYARKTPLFVRVAESQDKVILEVCDQGPGIPAEDHEKIFNQFERSRSLGERSGMGLGLFIVKEIVTLHGGTVSVSNLNTGGARFIVELPRIHS